MLNFSDRNKVNYQEFTSNVRSARQNCDKVGEETKKRPLKQLLLLVPQAGLHVGGSATSPRSSRTTHTPQSALCRSGHSSFRLTPNKQTINNSPSFTQKSHQEFLENRNQPQSTQIYVKQNSFRTFHNDNSSGAEKNGTFQDISNMRLKSNSQLRYSVTNNTAYFTSTLPPKPNKSTTEWQLNNSKDKQVDPLNLSKQKEKKTPSKFMPKHTRARTATEEDHSDHLNFKFKQQQSQTNTPKTSTPRTNTPSMEKSAININVQINNSNHTTATISNFQKFLAKKLNSTLSPKSQFRTLNLQDFDIGPCKGEGRFGKVYPALHKRTGFLLAIKKIKKQLVKGMMKQFIGQLKIGLFVSHANIVKTFGIFHDNTFIYVLMEYMEEGSLYRFVRNGCRLDEDEVTSKLLQICQAVHYMHSLDILHRDIKPENIVVSNGVCKLCDFGWAVCSRQRRKTYCGTLDYVCPEILQGESYDNEVDIWAIGVLAFEMLTGKAPFYHVSRQETMKSIMKCDFVFPEWMSPAAQAFISKALQKNPDRRITIEQLLKDNFLYKYGGQE